MVAQGRRAYAIIEYDGGDISEEIRQSLLSVTVTLNADSESSDDVSIQIADRELKWIGEWYPKVKAKEAKDSKK